MKLKKMLSVLLCILLMGSLPFPAFASDYDTSNGLSEEELSKLIADGTYELSDGNLVITCVEEVPNNGTSRIAGVSQSTFKATALTLIPREGAIEDLDAAAAELKSNTTGSNTLETIDSSYSVRIHTTIEYSYHTYGDSDMEYISIDYVSGGWTKSDRSVRIHSQYASINQKGGVYEGGLNLQQSVQQYPTGASWSYTPPSSWVPVSTETSFTSVGVLYIVYLRRGTETESTWNVSLNNTLVSNTT